MVVRRPILGALAAATTVVARIAPQKTAAPIFTIGNETTLTPEPIDSSCTADCRVRYPELQAISWVPEVQIIYTTEITVGTVSVYTTLFPNSTSPPRTHTVFNVDVPTEYSLWMVRSDGFGTAFLEVPLTISGTHTLKTLTYPTPWYDYPSEYHFEGVLPTTGKRAEPVCITATELNVGVLSPHPTYPQPTISPDEADLSGSSYQPLWVPVQELPDKKWFDATFPDVSAFASCESVAGKPAPTDFYAPKFVFETISISKNFTTTMIPIFMSTASGFEDTRTIKSTVRTTTEHVESSQTAFETSTLTGPGITKATGPHFMSTETGFEDPPDAHQTAPPPEITEGTTQPRLPVGTTKPQVPGVIGSIINNGKPPVSKPYIGPPPVIPALGMANPTPVFTLIPTVINGKPTASPAFILPGSWKIATIGEAIVVNGELTRLSIPAAVYTLAPTVVAGVSTYAPAYIISGSSTAFVDQTVTIDGQPTVLQAPVSVPTMIATLINGVQTEIPAYIISGLSTAFPGDTITVDGQTTVLPGPDAVYTSITTTIDGQQTVLPGYIIGSSITALPGQTVTMNGQPTVLSSPDIVYTIITTTINGKQTVLPGYIISGSIIATLGQTVTIDGTTTVLSTPTGTDTIDTRFGGPATTSFGGSARQTDTSKGAAAKESVIVWQAAMLGLGAFAIILL